jgi:hypothetical protein
MTLHYFEKDNLAKLNKAAKKAAIKTPHNARGGSAIADNTDNSDEENNENKTDVEEVDSLEEELYEMVVNE